jgi:hypothetical protein
MDCPRGDHGKLFTETYPVLALRCEECGYETYPGYAGNVADDAGSGARRWRTAEEKRVQALVIKGMVEDGYTNPQIVEITGYQRGQVQQVAREFRKNLDNCTAQDYNIA